MNNSQFRKLVLDTPRAEHGQSAAGAKGGQPPATPALGSRQRPSIPMTPRSVFTQTDFQRQLAAHNAPPTKKFRSSAAPRGTKLAEGYVNRTSLREQGQELDPEVVERERRLEALVELARDPKTGEVDMEMVIQQSKAMGGDVKGTHLVKGLDFALLERVRRGEDVMAEVVGAKEDDAKNEDELEKELDSALDKTIVPVEKEKTKKAGEISQKKTRAEILAELKRAKREAAVAAPAPVLGSKFKKISEVKSKKKKIEDRKAKKRAKRAEEEAEKAAALVAPLGMLPPLIPSASATTKAEDDEDEDIFEGVGDYDPLAGISDDSDDDSSGEEKVEKKKIRSTEPTNIPPEEGQSKDQKPFESMAPPPPPQKINYFNDDPEEEEGYKPPSSTSALLAQNPDLAAALAKAAKLAPLASSSKPTEEEEKEKKRNILLQNFDRDALDMDMGFGGSRDWGDDEEEEFVEGAGGGSKKRKRGGKGAKKGDKNDPDLVARMAKERYGKG